MYFDAVLDASVLFPAAIRDTLLRSAGAGLYRLHWTEMILEEMRRNLVATGRATEERSYRLVATMQRAFPEASITGYETLIDNMTNDPKDRHVLAAAVANHSQVIVTDNLRDFGNEALTPYNIESYSSDDFLTLLFEAAPALMTRVLMQQTSALRFPPKTYSDVWDMLSIQAPTFVERVTAHLRTETSRQ